MFKRILMVAVVGLGGCLVSAQSADAGIYFRPVAPVRRVAARAVLPPYPVARRVVAAPVVYRPVLAPAYYGPAYGPAYGAVGYGSPYVGYGVGVSVVVGY